MTIDFGNPALASKAYLQGFRVAIVVCEAGSHTALANGVYHTLRSVNNDNA